MASRLRAFDWRSHPLGDPESWAPELKAALGIGMNSSMPTAVYWGPDLRLIYNDAWSPIPAERHPQAIGERAQDVWADIWGIVGPQIDAVIRGRRGFSTYDQRLPMLRGGRVEETYWDYSFTPIFDAGGRVAGVFNQGNETTDRVMTTRAQGFLLEIGDRLRDLSPEELSADSVLSLMLGALGRHLGLARAGYATVDETGRICTVVGNWREERAADISAGEFLIADFGDEIATDMLAGRPVPSDDVDADPRHSEQSRASFRAIGVRANLAAPVVRGGRAVAFVFLNDDRPRRWTRHEIDLAREVADRIWSGLERANAAARLRTSERRFAALFGQAAVGLSEVTPDGRFQRVNESMGRILGRSPESLVGLTIADVTHPDDVAETWSKLEGSVSGDGASYEIEKRYLRPDGEAVWAVTHVARLIQDDGRPGDMFAVTTDITERKEQERIRAWLIAELNHRVKNNLATVQALAHHTRLSTASAEEFERVFNARLMALSRAHDLLMRETWTSAGLGDLVDQTLAPFRIDDGRRFVISGPEVRFSPTAAVTMTLALHELATNSARYGALSSAEGRVVAEWSVKHAPEGDVVHFEWRESGGPPVAPPARRGFGSRLIERGAARELGGQVNLLFAPEGVVCDFHLPLSRKIMVP